MEACFLIGFLIDILKLTLPQLWLEHIIILSFELGFYAVTREYFAEWDWDTDIFLIEVDLFHSDVREFMAERLAISGCNCLLCGR